MSEAIVDNEHKQFGIMIHKNREYDANYVFFLYYRYMDRKTCILHVTGHSDSLYILLHVTYQYTLQFDCTELPILRGLIKMMNYFAEMFIHKEMVHVFLSVSIHTPELFSLLKSGVR